MRPIASMPTSRPRQRTVQPTPEPKTLHISIISDKELSTLTKLNTARNEVYFCTLDRNVVKKDGPRPPSPNKVRTIAEREEEERKLGREARAKRRGKGNSGGESSGQEDTDGQPLSLADLLPPLKHIRGAGEDEDYQTPARPLKRTRKSGVAHAGEDLSPSGPKRKKNRMALMVTEETREEKFVSWDKGLVVIHRSQLSVPRHHREGESRGNLKSCLKRKESASISLPSFPLWLIANTHLPFAYQQIQLDHLGNPPNATAPVPKLKRNRIPVFCFWYDGEEAPAPAIVAPVLPAPPTVVATQGARRGKRQ